MKKNIEKQVKLECLCQSNEHYALKFIRKLEGFTKEKYSFVIIWKTRNIRSLFNSKDRTSHVSSVVYEGKFNCGENYIGETCRNVTVRWDSPVDTRRRFNVDTTLCDIARRRIDVETTSRVYWEHCDID